VEFILVHRRTPFFQLCTAVLFLSCSVTAMCAAQSSGSAKEDAASRASAVYQQGLSALQQGDLVSARAAFEKVLRLVPQSPEGHNSLGWVLFAQNEVDSVPQSHITGRR